MVLANRNVAWAVEPSCRVSRLRQLMMYPEKFPIMIAKIMASASRIYAKASLQLLRPIQCCVFDPKRVEPIRTTLEPIWSLQPTSRGPVLEDPKFTHP